MQELLHLDTALQIYFGLLFTIILTVMVVSGYYAIRIIAKVGSKLLQRKNI